MIYGLNIQEVTTQLKKQLNNMKTIRKVLTLMMQRELSNTIAPEAPVKP